MNSYTPHETLPLYYRVHATSPYLAKGVDWSPLFFTINVTVNQRHGVANQRKLDFFLNDLFAKKLDSSAYTDPLWGEFTGDSPTKIKWSGMLFPCHHIVTMNQAKMIGLQPYIVQHRNGSCNLGGYTYESHLEMKSFDHNLLHNCVVVSNSCTTHGSGGVMCYTKLSSGNGGLLLTNEISQYFSLSWVSWEKPPLQWPSESYV